ncbi:hypothetical protein EJ06DRAFT_545609 [Trichodelitschia bisporula]|uniref:Uncharacterized protein n=1 Tax=Trichodelitschia bisporula TaxID=703511 RepID=A0A6G1I9K6_9PEZI|nr:hypothetical protein EJ06DRAFT_545609 [Trichodelitschia bisporula]
MMKLTQDTDQEQNAHLSLYINCTIQLSIESYHIQHASSILMIRRTTTNNPPVNSQPTDDSGKSNTSNATVIALSIVIPFVLITIGLMAFTFRKALSKLVHGSNGNSNALRDIEILSQSDAGSVTSVQKAKMKPAREPVKKLDMNRDAMNFSMRSGGLL